MLKPRKLIVHNTIELFFLLFREFGLDIQVLDFDEVKWDSIRYHCIINKRFDLYNYAALLARAGIIKILDSSTDMMLELKEEIESEK